MARIVIAEDQLYLRNVLTLWLKRSGHDVVAVPDGLSSLASLREKPADMLITDVHMPGMSGIELVPLALAACPGLRRVFVVTSAWDPNDILRQLPDPRVRIFSKPFSPSQLLREVDLVGEDRGPLAALQVPGTPALGDDGARP